MSETSDQSTSDGTAIETGTDTTGPAIVELDALADLRGLCTREHRKPVAPLGRLSNRDCNSSLRTRSLSHCLSKTTHARLDALA